MWDPQWSAFAARYRTLRYDARGFGQSPLPAGAFSFADDLRALLDRVGMGRTALVGASMGANTALELAVLEPDRVAALVLAPPGMLDADSSEEIRRYDAAEEEALGRGDVDEAVRLNLDFWVAGPRRGLEDVEPAVVRKVAEMQRRAFELQVPAFDQQPAPSHERRVASLADELGRVRAPTLVIVGADDQPEIRAAADVAADSIAGARKVVLDGAAHVPNLERPDEFTELVLELLAELP